MPIWHQSPKLTPRYFLETPRLFGYPHSFIYYSPFSKANVRVVKSHTSVGP